MLGKYLGALILLIFSCKEAPMNYGTQKVRLLTNYEKLLVKSGESFGLTLFQKVNQIDLQKNVFISPLSVSFAFGMALNGAGSETYDAIKLTLNISDLSQENINQSYKSLMEFLTKLDPDVKLRIANSIFYRNSLTFKNEFLEVNKKYFNALVEGLNFSDPKSVEIINNWAKESTEGKIPKIIDKIDEYQIMFLINAIYFKGNWKTEFDKNLTEDEWFYKLDGDSIKCKMMSQAINTEYLENDDFQMIELPYSNGAYRMNIILPKPKKNINEVIASMTGDNLQKWFDKMTVQNVKLFLPKFTIRYNVTLNDILSAMGMGVAFDPERADFKKIYQGYGNAYISKVMQSTFVDVNEEGTEAAAVTTIEIGITSIREEPVVVRCDRPFIFLIREKNTNCVLFIGKLVDPS